MIKLFEQSSEVIIFFDRHGKIIAMNPAAEAIMTPEKIRRILQGDGHGICEVCRGFTSEAEQMTCTNCYMHNPELREFTSFQIFLETKGKEVVPYTASFQTIDPEEGTRVLMLRSMIKQYQTQEKLYQNKVMKHVIEAQESERRRISRELHDSVAQELMSAVVDLRVLKYLTDDEKLVGKMNQTEALMTRLLDDVRNLSVELRPATLDDFGLEAAFKTHFKRLEQSYGLLVDFTSSLDKKRYSSEIETVVYRVCQEAVMNALKYAQVDRVEVVLEEKEGMLQLVVEDQGAGFQPGSKPIGTGLGLFGMQERAELVGGVLRVLSKPGEGTRVFLQVPVPSGE
ncbi:ATP-binding protein [Paenibacillus pinistramenti]|uniref:sensor histidine kinase n=1 Tax=Paenibacillus pinistramenti TaxID=1768003 RepID=UPI001109641D|nr:ATP-binding protein [Paenibacillus pinistramenti]